MPRKNSPAILPEETAQVHLRRCIELFAKCLGDTDRYRSWLAEAGLTDLAVFERFQLGASDGGLPKRLPTDRKIQSELIQLGILSEKGAERLAHRIVFPMLKANGAIGNFWAIQKSAPTCFLPGRPIGVWNEAAAKLSPHLYVAPNLIEALSLISAGFANVIALDPNKGQPDVATLQQLGVQRLTIVVGKETDTDSAVASLQAKFHPYTCDVVVLQKFSSANVLFRASGGKALAEAVVAGTHGVGTVTVHGMRPRPDGFQLQLQNRLCTVSGLGRNGRRLPATIRVERGELMHVDSFADLNAAKQRKEFVKEVARKFEESVDLIEADLTKLINACEVRLAQPDLMLPGDPVDPVPEGDRKEAETLGKDPRLIELLLEHLTRMGIVGEADNKLLCYLAMTSRKLADPLAVMFVSSFGSGKNAIADIVRDLCPAEDRFSAAHLSGKALFHLAPDALKHRLIAIDELEGAKNAGYSLRVLISAQALEARFTSKDPATGRLQTEHKRIEGPSALLITTSRADPDQETLSRFILTSVDESAEQTRAIQEQQRRVQTLDGLADALAAKKSIARQHHAFQRLLQPLQVVIPDPKRIPFEDDRLASRRDFPKVIRLVKAIAFLRQMQKTVKQRDGINYIEADDYDLELAARLVAKLFGSANRELSKPSRDLLRSVHQMLQAAAGDNSAGTSTSTFSRRQVREFTRMANTTLHNCIRELLDFEYILRDSSTQRQQHRYTLQWEPGRQPATAPAQASTPSETIPQPFRGPKKHSTGGQTAA